MTRGNQRELARAKNQKKLEGKKTQDGKLVDRRERDAEVMRKKQETAEKKKDEQAAGGAGAAGTSKKK